MLGMADGWVAAAYWLCIASTVLCILYGAIKWNTGAEPLSEEEDRRWATDEEKIEDEL
jgi:hypothetical protein